MTFLRPGTEHVQVAVALIQSVGTAGDLTTDIQIAAAALECGGTVCSNDSDFATFEGLTRINPLR